MTVIHSVYANPLNCLDMEEPALVFLDDGKKLSSGDAGNYLTKYT